MPFEFDIAGWYIGGTASAGPRTVPTAPANKSTDNTPGTMRANWTGTAWVNAPYVPPTPIDPPPLPEDERLWWLDVGPFKDRLGMDAPAIYASNHAACRGVVGMLEGRKYIDLKDPRIAAMMGVLIASGQPAADPVWPGSGPMTAAKRDTILNTPSTEAERHIKGLEG